MPEFELSCYCGDVIVAEDEEEAIKKFLIKHNFPMPMTKDDYVRCDYAEEFNVKCYYAEELNLKK